MKIAFFNGYYLPHLGGVERYTEKLAAELAKEGHEVVIVTTNHANLRERERRDGMTIYRLPTYGLFKQRYPILKKDKELLRKIEAEGIDYFVLNTRFHLTSLLGAKMAKKLGKRAVVIDHGTGHFTVNNKVLDFFGGIYEHALTWRLKRLVEDYYGVSERCGRWLEHFGIKSEGVFYNAVDAKDFDLHKKKRYGKDFGSKTVIVYAGRIMREKGVELLLEAFLEIKDSYKNAVLVVAGDGGIMPELREKYKDPRIFFEGKLDYDELMALLNRADVFVHPSMYPEGLPTVILEAGLMKCAVVATDRGGSKEVIKSDEYGMIIEENKTSLKRALTELLNKPAKTRKIGERLQRRVREEFVWGKTAKRIVKDMERGR
ncbi:glycosyltransferase family 4 protein [Candidatus Saccharibacteria bacterium]|nr:glycosyltransferase family 4 protein [Candidatus Saccharibacteria bacterium]